MEEPLEPLPDLADYQLAELLEHMGYTEAQNEKDAAIY